MSKYEWESGEVKIPAAEWSVFKCTLQTSFTALLARRYELAMELFNHLRTAGKGKRNFDFVQEADKWAQAQQPTRQAYDWAGMNRGRCANIDDRAQTAYDIIGAVLPHVECRRKPKMPKKQDFKSARNTLRFGSHLKMYWDASLVLDPKTRAVHWNVSENNHARQRAWDHPMGIALHRALTAVKWTRNSGGQFIGNDEYNRDSRYEGGGGNYVTRRFGPLGNR